MFRGMEWGRCYYRERPWDKVYVDCDSLILTTELVVGSKLKGMNTFDTRSAMGYVLRAVATYSEKRLEAALKRLGNNIDHTVWEKGGSDEEVC